MKSFNLNNDFGPCVQWKYFTGKMIIHQEITCNVPQVSYHISASTYYTGVHIIILSIVYISTYLESKNYGPY